MHVLQRQHRHTRRTRRSAHTHMDPYARQPVPRVHSFLRRNHVAGMPHSYRCCQWLTALALVVLLAVCPTATAPPAATAARLSKAAEVQPGSSKRQDLEASEAAASSAEIPAVGAPCQDTMHALGGAAAGNPAMVRILPSSEWLSIAWAAHAGHVNSHIVPGPRVQGLCK